MTEEIEKLAREKHQKIEAARNSPRFLRVMGRFVHEKLLVSNQPVQPYKQPVPLKDVLWAGQFEPRIYELIPAIILKKPSFLVSTEELPHDLRVVLQGIKKGNPPPEFRGIPAKNFLSWVERVGHRGKTPSQLKSFRFTRDDREVLEEIKRIGGFSETQAVREGLKRLRDELIRAQSGFALFERDESQNKR